MNPHLKSFVEFKWIESEDLIVMMTVIMIAISNQISCNEAQKRLDNNAWAAKEHADIIPM